jgi:hypothetical protein
MDGNDSQRDSRPDRDAARAASLALNDYLVPFALGTLHDRRT